MLKINPRQSSFCTFFCSSELAARTSQQLDAYGSQAVGKILGSRSRPRVKNDNNVSPRSRSLWRVGGKSPDRS